jgi:hypothetical protein
MFFFNQGNSVNRILALTLGFALTISLSPLLSTAYLQVPAGSSLPAVNDVLTNDHVLKMSKDGIAPEVIIAKINSSTGRFDTSPSTIPKLKEAGLTDAVVLAMIGSGMTQPSVASPNSSTSGTIDLKVVDGTEIEIALTNNVSGQEAQIGDIVDFTVLRPVQLNGVTIFEKGASARGRITTAKKSGHWGKAGKLEWAMQDVQAVDGSRVPARFTKRLVGDSSGGTVAVAAVATAVLLGPVALLWGLKKGKVAIIPAGNRYTAFVQGDSTVKTHRDSIVNAP